MRHCLKLLAKGALEASSDTQGQTLNDFRLLSWHAQLIDDPLWLNKGGWCLYFGSMLA